MAKYIAEIQDASGNTVYPATQWGAITNPPTIQPPLVDTGWVKVALTNATGDVFIRKIGKHVMMRGSFKTTVSSSVTNQLGLVDSLPNEFKSTTSYSPIIELAGPWDPRYIIVQVACSTGKIAQIGGTTNTTVEVESIRWEVD